MNARSVATSACRCPEHFFQCHEVLGLKGAIFISSIVSLRAKQKRKFFYPKLVTPSCARQCAAIEIFYYGYHATTNITCSVDGFIKCLLSLVTNDFNADGLFTHTTKYLAFRFIN